MQFGIRILWIFSDEYILFEFHFRSQNEKIQGILKNINFREILKEIDKITDEEFINFRKKYELNLRVNQQPKRKRLILLNSQIFAKYDVNPPEKYIENVHEIDLVELKNFAKKFSGSRKIKIPFKLNGIFVKLPLMRCAFALDWIKKTLSEAQIFRCNLKEFIIVQEIDTLFERKIRERCQLNGAVGRFGAHVGQVFAFATLIFQVFAVV